MQPDCPTTPERHESSHPDGGLQAADRGLEAALRHAPRSAVHHVLAEFARRWVGPAAIALLLFEGLIRTFIYSPRPQVSDPVLGPVPAPGSTWVNGREGYGRVHWNRQGVRGRDLPADNGAKVPRVVVMGDSYTRAEEVHDDQTFCALLERQLAGRLGREVWVGNCGRVANDAADYLYHLPAYERKFRPDLVLIAFTLSDFRLMDGRIIPGVSAQFDPAATRGDGLTTQPEAEGKEGALLKRYLPGGLANMAQAAIDGSSLSLYGAARLYAVTFRPPLEAKYVSGVEHIATTRQMERYLAALVARVKSPVACVYINPWSPLLVKTNDYFDRVAEQRLQAAAARLRIPMVATGTAFQAYVTRSGQPAIGYHKTELGPGEGHLNRDGHRIMAECLTPAMTRLLDAGSRLQELRLAQLRAREPAERRARSGRDLIRASTFNRPSPPREAARALRGKPASSRPAQCLMVAGAPVRNPLP
jgi:lysophospholipase L1-like esterase